MIYQCSCTVCVELKFWAGISQMSWTTSGEHFPSLFFASFFHLLKNTCHAFIHHLTWVRSLRLDIASLRPDHSSKQPVWRWPLSSPGAIPPAAHVHAHPLKDGPEAPESALVDFCPHEEKVSLSFNLIIGRWTEKAQARKRSEKTGDRGNLLVWLKSY